MFILTGAAIASYYLYNIVSLYIINDFHKFHVYLMNSLNYKKFLLSEKILEFKDKMKTSFL